REGRQTNGGRGRADAREIPQELVEAGADEAERSYRYSLRDARRQSHVPEGSSNNDPHPERVVPAGRPQSAKVHEHLSGEGRRLPEGHAADLPFGEIPDAFEDWRVEAVRKTRRQGDRAPHQTYQTHKSHASNGKRKI